METPKHSLTNQQSKLLSKIRTVLPEKLYFYGSILRDDFLPGISDVDILYFSKENLKKTVDELYRFLLQDTNKTRLQKLHFLYHSTETKKVISGYKIKYTSIDSGVVIEISFYEFPYKEMIIKEQLRKADIPFYVVYSMLILKVLAYRYRILPENLFRWIKDRLFINMSGIKNTFLPIEHEEKK